MLLCLQNEGQPKQRRCPTCDHPRSSIAKTKDGSVHRVFGRAQNLWCPYADTNEELDQFIAAQREQLRASWRRANAEKRRRRRRRRRSFRALMFWTLPTPFSSHFHSIFIPFLSQSGGESYQQTEGVIYAVLLVQESWHMPAVCVLHLRGVLLGLLPVMGQPLQEWRKHCQGVDELELEWLKYQER